MAKLWLLDFNYLQGPLEGSILFIYSFIYLFIYLFIHLSIIYLLIHLFIYSFIYLFTHFSVHKFLSKTVTFCKLSLLKFFSLKEGCFVEVLWIFRCDFNTVEKWFCWDCTYALLFSCGFALCLQDISLGEHV